MYVANFRDDPHRTTLRECSKEIQSRLLLTQWTETEAPSLVSQTGFLPQLSNITKSYLYFFLWNLLFGCFKVLQLAGAECTMHGIKLCDHLSPRCWCVCVCGRQSQLNAMHKSDAWGKKQNEAKHNKVTLTLRRSKQSESCRVRTSDYTLAAVWCPHTGAAAAHDQLSHKIDPTQTLTRGLDEGILGTKCLAIRVTVKVNDGWK